MLKSAPVTTPPETPPAIQKTKPKRPVGRPAKPGNNKHPVIRPDIFLEDMEKWGRLGLRLKDVSDLYGYGYSNFFQLLVDFPTLKEHYLKGRAMGVSKATRYLWRHIKKGDKASLFFFLERMAGFVPKSELQVETTNKPPVELSIGQQRLMAQAVLDSIQDVSVVDSTDEAPVMPQLEVSAVERVLESGEKALAGEMAELAVMSDVKAGVSTQARRVAQQRAYDEGKLAKELAAARVIPENE